MIGVILGIAVGLAANEPVMLVVVSDEIFPALLYCICAGISIGNIRIRRSLPDLPFSFNYIFITGQFGQSHRASGVQLLRTDADFRPEPEFKSVRKPCRGIDIDAGGILHALQHYGI